MEQKIPKNSLNFENLPIDIQLRILQFLNIQEIQLNFQITSKSIYKTLKSPILQRNIIAQLFGINLQNNFNTQNINQKLVDQIIQNQIPIQQTLQNLFNTNRDIDIYGFKSDGGIDACELSYWVDKMFTKNLSGVCTDEGQNFNIVGHIKKQEQDIIYKAQDMADKLIEKLCEFLLGHSQESLQIKKQMLVRMIISQKMENEDINLAIKYLKKTLQQQVENLKCYKTNKFYKNNNDIDINVLKSQFLEEEVSHQQVHKHVSIAKSIHIFRNSNSHYNCPVKTLACFASLDYVNIEQTEILKMFNDINDKEKVVNLVHKLNLSIQATNIEKLRNQCVEFDDKIRKEKSMPYIIFKNNNFTQQINPILWIQFTNKDIPEIKLQFGKNNFFAGRYFVTKLIDCEDLINNQEEDDDQHEDTNIDIGYTTFQGVTIDL